MIASQAVVAIKTITLHGRVLQQGNNRPIMDAVVFVTSDDRVKERINPRHEILAGVNYSQQLARVDLDQTNCPHGPDSRSSCEKEKENVPRYQYKDQFTMNLWEMYARDRWLIVKDVTFIGGMRLTHDDYLAESFAEPRLGLEWDLGAQTLVTAGWGKYHQFPPLDQVIAVFGNPDLRHIRASHSVIGIEHIVAPWSWKVEAY